MNPFKLKEDNGGHLVPCGKCLNCRRRRVSSWSVRLVKEGERSHESVFLTLTYNNDHLPFSNFGFPTLVKKHVQGYMKRLRRLHPPDHKKLTYYAVGEYGSQTKRPHYHMILFNADPLLLERAWRLKNQPIGDIHIGTVAEASIGYCLKYISKKCNIGKDQKKDDRQPNFSLMSKGIGKNYLTPKMVQWHKNKPEERVYVPLKDGKKAPLPRYFKQLIYDESEKEKIAYHFQKESQKLLESELLEHGNNLPFIKSQQFLDGNRKMELNKNAKL